MNKLAEILKAHKYAIIWTIGYICAMWAILLFMFNFNIFVGRHWHMLMNAQIRGFAGFVFGLLILSAVPIYIATTTLIIRNKEPLININIAPITKILHAIIPHPVMIENPASPQATETTEQQKNESSGDTDDTTDKFPDTMPNELRGAFIRARQHLNLFTTSAFNAPNDTAPVSKNTTDTDPTPQIGELPLPDDFSFDTDSDFTPPMDMPTFTDIDFDDDTDTDESENDDEEYETGPDAANDTNDDNIINYLTDCGVMPVVQDDMIIAKDLIIATHSDPDFWIADSENWFAAGKQKPSPIIQLIKASAQAKLQPVLYLASTNIMDLDTRRAEWAKMGVTTITDLDELPL